VRDIVKELLGLVVRLLNETQGHILPIETNRVGFGPDGKKLLRFKNLCIVFRSCMTLRALMGLVLSSER
jgi:hypothetical protein